MMMKNKFFFFGRISLDAFFYYFWTILRVDEKKYDFFLDRADKNI